jgi:hypothetical protein
MKLKLNEQEIVDSVCCFVAEVAQGNPEQVEVKELNVDRKGRVTAEAKYGFRFNHELSPEEIIEGIEIFLEENHSFDPNVMTVMLNYTEGEGVWAEVLVNE